MKRMCIVLITMVIVFGYATHDLDGDIDQVDVVCPVNPVLQTIEDQLDQAKANGDAVRFKELLTEYKKLNPPVPVEDGPQIIVNESFPALDNRRPLQPLWADDQIVDSAYYYHSMSMDTRNDGTIWLVASRQINPGDDYILSIWASDDGVHWPWAANILWGNHHLLYPSLKIVEQADSTYLIIAYSANKHTAPNETDLWVVRHAFEGDWSLHPISRDECGDETRPSLDADDLQYFVFPYLYCAFEYAKQGAFKRSVDLGLTWTQMYFMGAWFYDAEDPSCAYGWHTAADSFDVGVVFVMNYWNTLYEFRVERNYLYGNARAWTDLQYLNAPSGCYDLRPSLKMTHGVMPSATITFARRKISTGAEVLCNWYTYDGGRTWTNDILYGQYGSDIYASLNCLTLDDYPSGFHVFFKGIGDDIMHKKAFYNLFRSRAWSDPIVINDGGNVSDATKPASAVRNGQPCVCWQEIRGTKNLLKFDAVWAHRGIDEITGIKTGTEFINLTPNPSRGRTNLSVTLTQEGLVTVSLFDVSGRLVRTLTHETMQPGTHTIQLNIHDMAAGVYLLRTNTPDGQQTTTMTVIK
jgi:hypothetical protein